MVIEFVPISELRKICGYADRRSITRWVRFTLGIELHKVGKNWCVVKEEFDTAISLRFGGQKESVNAKVAYTPQNESERQFLAELDVLLSETREV